MRRNRQQKLSPLQIKKLWRAGAVIVLSAFVWLLIAPDYGVLSLLRKRSELQKLQQEAEHLTLENKRLELEIDRLKNDPEYLEQVARRDYGLLKTNERVYDFSGKDSKKK